MKLWLGFFAGVFCLDQKCITWKDTGACGGGAFIFPTNATSLMEVRFHSQENYRGEPARIQVKGLYGCSNQLPDFRIKSLLSTGSIKLFLHSAPDCLGSVIHELQGGSASLPDSCPKSIFVKFNRYGSC